MADVTGSGKSTELVLTDGHMFNVFFPHQNLGKPAPER